MKTWALFFCAVVMTSFSAMADTTALLWRDALNQEVYRGQLMLEAPQGVAQIKTDRKLYQICHLRDAEDEAAYLKAQAKDMNLQPTLVVILDGPDDNWKELSRLNNTLARWGVRMQVANSLVPIEKVAGLTKAQKKVWKAKSTAKTEQSSTTSATPSQVIVPVKAAAVVVPLEGEYWLNTKSNIRHNKDCRYYGKGKNGRPCTKDEGRACKVCGG